MVEARLDDRHPDLLKVVQLPEEGSGAEAVEPELRVAGSLHPDALAVFEVDDLDRVTGDHDRVCRTEALRRPVAQVEPLLHHHGRGGILLQALAVDLHHAVPVVIGSLFHFAAVKLGLERVREALVVILLRDLVDGQQDFVLRDQVRERALVRISAGRCRREFCRDPHGAGAVDPPGRR